MKKFVSKLSNTKGALLSADPVSIERVHSHKLAANITDCLVPEKDKTYVPFGFYNNLKKIIEARIFYTVYIVGLSGNGKTLMVEQVCANLDREMIRVNITKDTDETDLIGSYELIDGNTVRREGPVITAMRKGAILLLDETDYGTERLLCLQPILEGKPYLDKKTGEVITPAAGFNIIATANTKGKGSDNGMFIGANTLNEAFLERFAITVEQEYPSPSVEKTILERNFKVLGMKNDDKFIDNLVTWAENVRKTFKDGGCQDIISTRRLVHITKAYHIFNDRDLSIELCLNRFDDHTKHGFIDLYNKIDDSKNEKTPDPVKIEDCNNPDLDDEIDDIPVVSSPPAAVAALPKAPTFKSALQASQLQKAATPKTINPNDLPAFATPRVLFDISTKFSEKVSVTKDGNDYVVTSHGKTTRVDIAVAKTYPEKKSGEILDLLVSANQAKLNGAVTEDYRPVN